MISLLLFGFFSTASANERAKELFTNGAELYNQGRYESAITAWKEAYGLDPRPVLLFNLSNAYERSGQFSEALDALTRYRPLAKPGEGEALDSRIRSLEDRVSEIEEAEKKAEAERLAAQQALAEERRKAEELARQQAIEASKGGAPVLPIVVTAAGVGMMGFGAMEALSARKVRKILKDPAVCSPAGICKLEAEAAFKTQRRAALLADVGLLSGALVTGLGVVLFARPAEEEGVSLTPWLNLGDNAPRVGVNGVF